MLKKLEERLKILRYSRDKIAMSEMKNKIYWVEPC